MTSIGPEAVGSGGRLVTPDGRPLPLRGVTLRAQARAGLARVALTQRFVNPYCEALRVTYLVPLPADGVLAGYAFRIGDRRVVGEVDRVAAARRRFEEALLEGHTAGLIEQDRPDLFTLELGNVPPGAEVTAELAIDQPLAWLDECAWEWRFPTVVAPRYQGAPDRVPDADRVTVDVAEGGVDVEVEVALSIGDDLLPGGAVTSPSHEIAVAPGVAGFEVSFCGEGVALDRDVVVRWPVALTEPGLALDVARPAADRRHARHAYGLLTVTPPLDAHRPPAMPRDLILLIDTSGSMSGEPLEQAKAIATALVASLGDADRLEMLAFASEPRRWRRSPARATENTRAEAVRWLGALRADGSTEMRDAVVEALRPLRRDAQRQVVLITDGLIGFEAEIVAALARELPAGSRLHTVGVGPAPNRTLTATAARAGRGVEVVVGLGEDVGRHVARLLARMREPVLTEVKVSGSALVDHGPRAVPDVYGEAPLRLALRLRPEGGDLQVQARTASGPWSAEVRVPAVEAGHGSGAVIALYGRETVEDLEVRRAAGWGSDQEIERVGLEFQIATRLTSWVAVSEEPDVDPRQPGRRVRMPHALPAGLSIEGLGLRAPAIPDSVRALFRPPEALAKYRHTPLPPRPVDAAFHSFVSGWLADDVQEPPAFRRREPDLPVRRLVARLVLRADRDLHFEIDMDEARDWTPADVRVFWPDGAAVPAQVVADRATTPGPVAAGLTVRLALRLEADGPAAPPARLGLMLGGRPVMIDVVNG